MIDKKYVEQLTKSLFFEMSDEQINKILKELQDIQGMIQQAKKVVNPNIEPSNYPRVVNCSKLRADKPVVDNEKKDYLSNAKTADKYVVGK